MDCILSQFITEVATIGEEGATGNLPLVLASVLISNVPLTLIS